MTQLKLRFMYKFIFSVLSYWRYNAKKKEKGRVTDAIQNRGREEGVRFNSAVNQERRDGTKLIPTSSVLRRSTPVGPEFKARSTPCSRISLTLSPFAFFFSPSLCMPSLHPPALLLRLRPSSVSFSISRCTSAVSRPHIRGYTHVDTRACTYMYVRSITAILSELPGHLASPWLPLFLSFSRNNVVVRAARAVIHHRLEISGQ